MLLRARLPFHLVPSYTQNVWYVRQRSNLVFNCLIFFRLVAFAQTEGIVSRLVSAFCCREHGLRAAYTEP